jgi:hypothetical protein
LTNFNFVIYISVEKLARVCEKLSPAEKALVYPDPIFPLTKNLFKIPIWLLQIGHENNLTRMFFLKRTSKGEKKNCTDVGARDYKYSRENVRYLLLLFAESCVERGK